MEVDYPRVTHPFAGLLTLAGFLPRLACVRHAASVRSEPGSNSPINFFLERQRLALTSLLFHSKHCGVRNLFRGLAIQFSKTGQITAPAHHQLPTPPPDPPCHGGALPTAVRCFVSRPFASGPVHAPRLQGAAHVAKALRGVTRPSSALLLAYRRPRHLRAIPLACGAPGRPGRPPCCLAPRWLRGAPPAPAGRPVCKCGGR